MPDGTGHQPLNLSLNCFVKEENAFAFGYAEMDNIPLEIKEGRLTIPDFEQNLYVSVGQVSSVTNGFAKLDALLEE